MATPAPVAAGPPVPSRHGPPEEVQIATLLVRLGGAQASAFASLLAPLGLRPKQFGLMNVVALADGPSQGEIGAAMGIDPSGLIATIDDLEERGWLERRRDPDDARVVALHVTAAGKRLTKRILPIAERYETVALKGFSTREAEVLRRALSRLYANMEALER